MMISGMKDVNDKANKIKESVALLSHMLEEVTGVVIEDMCWQKPRLWEYALQKLLQKRSVKVLSADVTCLDRNNTF